MKIPFSEWEIKCGYFDPLGVCVTSFVWDSRYVRFRNIHVCGFCICNYGIWLVMPLAKMKAKHETPKWAIDALTNGTLLAEALKRIAKLEKELADAHKDKFDKRDQS